jgi:eukaryotic-like serine/threonine-protein kinase
MPLDSDRVQAVFQAAVEARDPPERVAILNAQCGDNAELRARVEALLQMHDQHVELPNAGTIDFGGERLGTLVGSITAEAGKIIAGRYRLLEEIGEGGMGTVWVAEQTQPVRRRVALKLIKPGMDSRTVLARFEVERQALALMDHPNIAKVLDGGVTDQGSPFFVMEYVKGVPLTEYCDKIRVTVEGRLALFVQVCHAVQHAHQKGIIHRDLKPSNILVALYDGVPIPKVIDFGLAKAMIQPLTERTLYTGHGVMVGTPLYMSPEQAELNNLDVDTRTDIYSLGVILYELLTGTTPLDRQRCKQAAWQEIVRLIKEEEPSKPSTKLSGSGSLPSVAAQRQIEPAQLTRLVRGDLDWIALKALEKERSRRYETPNALALDVQRHLTDQPVEACPPSTAYRVRKFVRRNRVVVLTMFAILAALGMGTVIATWQAVVATRAKRDALDSANAEKAAKQQAQAAAAAEKAAKETAQAKEAEARTVLNFVQTKVFAAARPKNVSGGLGREVSLRRALEAALPAVANSFEKQPLIEAQVRTTLGDSFSLLGDPKIAVEQYERARSIYLKERGPDDHETLVSTSRLARSLSALSRYDEAISLEGQTLARLKAKYGPSHADTLVAMNNLANSYSRAGRYADGLKLHEETLALRRAALPADDPHIVSSINNVASAYFMRGRPEEALKLFQEALRLRQAHLGKEHPDTLESMHNLSECYLSLGRYAEALELGKETLALGKETLGPDHPDTLSTMMCVANCYTALGQIAEAAKLHEETLARRQKKLGRDHPETLNSMHNLACARYLMGQRAEGLKLYEEAIALRKAKFGANHPATVTCIMEMSALRFRDSQKTGNAEDCRKIVASCEDLRTTDPNWLYNLACYRAVTAALQHADHKTPRSQELAKADADRAMDWLKKAVAAGYKDVAKIKTDKDLDTLRERSDFRQLLEGMASTKK